MPGRLSFEPLEVRSLLNAATPADALASFPPNETIDQAWDLGTPSQPATTVGSVGTGPDGAADVTWYHFQLQDASQVAITVSTPSGDRQFASVLSLFNSDPQDWSDPYDVDGYRMLAQVQADPKDGLATYTQDLGPGDYYVAVSGGGNTAFSPVIAGSGYPGEMGIYELTISATDLGLSGDGPTILTSDPPAGAVLDSSPLAIRVELSGPLDPNSIVAGQTVQLLAVSGDVETPVALASVNFSAAANELQLFPQAPLAPGQYVVQLAGNSNGDPAVLVDPNGIPLGDDAQDPAGVDESFTFQVAGIDGVGGATASDDTAAAARDLGNLVGAAIVQVDGAIGVDPNLSPGFSADQVDLYHFQITGPGRYAMLAEVFAGRIGSPLDPGVSLFELDPTTGSLIFLAGNNNTLDPTQGTDGSTPLFTDSYLTAGLTAGDYYLAVADGSNTPSPIEGQMPGSPGILDPNQPGSARNGWSTGAYQLNVLVQPNSDPPRVVASSPSPGQVLSQAPTQITVQFSEPVNIQQLAYQAYEVAYLQSLPQVFVEGADGTIYYARFLGYNPLTNTATFQMLDGLPNGSYSLHLSGPGGLTDLGGNPLPGNDPSGDFAIPFMVQGADRGVSGSMAAGFRVFSQAGQGVPQDIGVLFPDELQAGVDILRYPESSTDPGAGAPQDEYVIQVLQFQYYSFQLIGGDLPAGTQVTLTDASGQSIPLDPSPDGQSFTAQLDPGTYTVSVGGWPAGESADIAYQLLLDLYDQQDNAPPLVDGPAPALQVSFDTSPALAGSASSGGPTLSGGTGAFGPISGATGGSIGGAEPVGSIAGPVSSVSTGSSGSASLANPTAVSVSPAEAALGLAGLGMGPLGGSGVQAGPLASPTIQVALNVPATPALASNSLAVSLVTLTQVFSWNREAEGEGERIDTAKASDPQAVEASDPSGGAANGLTVVQTDASAGPRGDSTSDDPAVATGADPTPSLGIIADPPGLANPVVPIPVGDTHSPRVDALAVTVPPPPQPAAAVAPRLGAGTWAARWAIAAATLVALYRAQGAVRGRDWRKRTTVVGARTAGPTAPRTPHPGTTIVLRAGGCASAQSARTRSLRGVPAAPPRP
jgi:methionine-rich copper-binding protein CopC